MTDTATGTSSNMTENEDGYFDGFGGYKIARKYWKSDTDEPR